MRKLTLVLSALILSLGCGATTHAQTYPSRPVTIVCAYEPGGATDTQSRVIAERLTKSLHQSVIVENRPGASGAVGMGQLKRAAPDGYTLGTTDLSPMVISPHIFTKLPFSPKRDFKPVIQLSQVDLVLVVNPDVPVKSVAELIALLKAHPDQYKYASFGTGSISHLAAESFKFKAGVKMQHVPYAGSVAAFPDLLSGRVPIMFSVAPPTMAYIKSGKMRALAVTGTKRNPELPDVPTMIEAGIPDFDAVSWFAFFAPAKTPDDVVAKLNADINAALKDPAVAEKFHSLGMTIVGGSPKHLGDLVDSENDKWGAVIKEAGLKPLD